MQVGKSIVKGDEAISPRFLISRRNQKAKELGV